MNISKEIRAIEDYPIEGVTFRDISTLFRNKDGFRESIDSLSELTKKYNPDLIVGVEARGFIVGAPVAYCTGAGFVMVRKPGKLPSEKISKDYGLEYGEDRVEMHVDNIKPGEKVVIIDDLLATGGTTKATIELVEELGGIVEACIFLIELTDLTGREILEGYKVESVIQYND